MGPGDEISKRPNPSSPQQAPERERIRQAFLDLCLESGYRRITLPILLARADVEEAAFRCHFDDLEDCFCSIYEDARDELFGRIRLAIVDQPTWRDAIRATAYVFLRFLREDRRIAHLAVVEARSAGERAQLMFSQASDFLFDLIDGGRKEREDLDAISRTTAESIGGGIFSQIYAGVLQPSPPSEDAVPELMYAAVLPYVGEDAAQEELHIPAPSSVPDELAVFGRALIELCFERTFAQVTIDALCDRAGLDLSAFRRHFTDLEDCFFQVYAGELERYRRQARVARAGLSDWRDRVRATAYALYRFLDEDEKVRKFTVVEVRAAGERTELLVGQEIEALFSLIDEGRRELTDPGSLTRATAESVGGGIFNRMYTEAGQKGPMPAAKDIVPEMMYAAVLPYVGCEAALEELRIPPPRP